MNITASMFRAYDIRGVVTESLTPDAVRAIGRAFGSECLVKNISQVVVARDGRLSGPALVAALIEGLVSTGCEVIDIGQQPTPVLYYATYQLKTGTGIVVTGSHNPPDYNGLKMMMGGETLHGEMIQRVLHRIEKDDYHQGQGSQRQLDLESDYLQRIVGDVNLSRPLKVAVDCGNGVAGELAPKLLRALGCEVEELYCEIDGTFPNHHPDPSKLENLQELIERVANKGLDLGLAFDGDGDRVGVIDSDGHVIWPDRQMMLYARDVLSRHPGGRIVYDVKCSSHLASEIEAAGGVADMWKTGHSLMKARIQETGALLGGEMSGHIFFKERWYGFDDALYAAARLLEILSQSKLSSAELFAQLPDSLNTPELNVHFANEGDNFRFMAQLTEQVDFSDANIITLDGLRIEFADGWGLVRASNTTPSLVIRFEADQQAALDRIQGRFRSAMLAVDDTLSLPF
ncbi:MAG: phosphomannomutase/phosphoglucomutase [Gammaproteobacteria bacterium]|nr:phosphomannomutase/phosphoglucomutase [Gammaproteobacteria bacterium]